MSRRPDTAADCPGCDSGWVDGPLLCPRCTQAVQRARPGLLEDWLKARAAHVALAVSKGPLDMEQHTTCVAIEAFHRGLLVGTARCHQRPKKGTQA